MGWPVSEAPHDERTRKNTTDDHLDSPPQRAAALILVLLLAASCADAARNREEADDVAFARTAEALRTDFGFGYRRIDVRGAFTEARLLRVLAAENRVIAVDLIGMGKSGKPDIDYTFDDHRRYLDAFIRKLRLRDVALVVHDWGSALGLDYAARNPDNVRGVAFMEAIIPPVFPASFSALPPAVADFFRVARDPVLGPPLILEQNIFIEEVLPANVLRSLAEAELEVYRAPYPNPDTRRPLLVWPNQVPIDGEPTDVVAVVGGSAALFETVGRIDPEIFETDTSGYTQYGRAYLSLQSFVPDAQFISGYVRAAAEAGVEYTPIVDGVPSLYTGGAAFPGNDWTENPDGQAYLARIPTEAHRALGKVRTSHLRATRRVLRKIARIRNPSRLYWAIKFLRCP